jgi:hypothetical protein
MKKCVSANAGGGGALFGLGWLGAVVFYLQQASNLSEGLLGLLKSFFWPAFLVYELFGHLAK